jgi:uncharacterized repeat protein (TIGR01451 family)
MLKKHKHHIEVATPAISSNNEVDEGLAAIYGDSHHDLAKLDKAGSRLTRILTTVVLVLAATAVVAVIAFVIYINFFAVAKEDPLSMSIEVPAEVVSGTDTMVIVHYKNNGRVPIASLKIDVNIPLGFAPTAITPTPTDDKSQIFEIGSVAAGTEGTVSLSGMWLTSVPSTNTVQALATYRPANFNADFTAVASATVASNSSSLVLTMTGPDKAAPGESTSYTLTLENTSEKAATNITTAVTIPAGFLIISSDPALVPAGPMAWSLAELASHAKQVITLNGSWSADLSDVVQLVGEVSVKPGEVLMTQAESSVFTNIIGNGLRLGLAANGTTSGITLNPGSPLRLTVSYEDTGSDSLTGVGLVVDFQSVEGTKIPITWLEATIDGGRLSADGIVFDAKTIGTLTPQEAKTRNLIFPVREALASGEAQSWTVSVHATVNEVTISSQPLTVTLNSDTNFTAAARYFTEDGAPLGSGVLPPKVGETTQYNLLWSVSNTLHSLTDVRVSATLPPGVTWGGLAIASEGTISYDETSRVVTWTLSSAAVSSTALTASFEVSVTPSQSDAGTFVKLLSGSAFRATDSVTASSLQQTGDILTTECVGDDGVSGKGYVSGG